MSKTYRFNANIAQEDLDMCRALEIKQPRELFNAQMTERLQLLNNIQGTLDIMGQSNPNPRQLREELRILNKMSQFLDTLGEDLEALATTTATR